MSIVSETTFSVFTDQPAAFFAGAALLAIFQVAKFAELDVADPVADRVISLLPGAKAKDFTGRTSYHVSLGAFVVVSLCLYYLICQISPDILSGVIQMSGGKAPNLKGIPYPLYVAALFMGLTQPVVPGLAKAGNSLRNFFHDRIEVPKRVVNLTARLSTAIDARSGSDKNLAAAKKNLTNEVKKLIDDAWLTQLQSCGDLAFYKMQLQRIKLGDPTTATKTLKDSSVKELRDYVDQLVLFNLIAVMRQSGPQHLGQIAKWAQTRLKVEPYNIGFFLTTLALTSLIFGFLLALVWLALDYLGPLVVQYFNFGAFVLWPKPEWLGVELARIVPATFVSLLVSLYLVMNRPPNDAQRQQRRTTGNAFQNFIVFTQSVAGILLVCFIVALAIHFIAEAYQYAISHQFAEMVTFEKFVIIFVRTAPSVALSFCGLLYLSPEWRGPRFSFGSMFLIAIISVAITALVVVQMFLHLDYLPALHKLAANDPSVADYVDFKFAGWDYVVFYVLANVLVAACAFATVGLFFHAQSVAPMKAFQTRLQQRRGERLLAAMAETPRPAISLVRAPSALRRSRPPSRRSAA